jgi:hypothetical protein
VDIGQWAVDSGQLFFFSAGKAMARKVGCQAIAVRVKGKGVEITSAHLETSPQRLRYFSKRGETLKIFCLSDRREAAKDFWLSALAGPAGP